MNKRISRTIKAASAALLLGCAGAAMAQPAQSGQPTFTFDQQSEDLASALRSAAKTAGVNLVAPDELLAGRVAPELHGQFSAAEAIARLLAGTDLAFRQEEGAFIISRSSGETPPPLRTQQAGESSDIVITGSHLRGAPVTSPLITITRKQIDQAAPASVEELMRKIPQNLSSGVAEENFAVTGTHADITDHGAGINLRGLGQRATLVLVNGRRVAPADTGSFVDVSLIPVSAIERVEILTDGASAIYGSDAVGGVVNIILRKDFDGLETMVQGGTTTDGGGGELLASATAGKHWRGGRALLSYEYRAEQPITAGDRDFTIGLPDNWSLFPRERRHNVYGTLRQELTDRLSLDLTGTYSARNTDRSFIDASAITIGSHAEARAYGGSAAFDLDLGGSWLAEASGQYYRDRTHEEETQAGALFNHFDTMNAAGELLAKVDGNLIALPGGPLKAAFGGGIRHESFSSLFRSQVNLPTLVAGSRNVSSAYGEFSIPVFSHANRLAGVEQLTLTAAGRFEHYQRIGSTFNPKLGLLWSPLSGLALRGSYGTSFRAPLLYESYGIYNAFLLPAPVFFVDPSQAISGVGAALVGANPNVKPERSKSFTAGLDLAPPMLRNFHASATYYAIRFTNRIAFPSEQIVVIGDPAYAPIVSLHPDINVVTNVLNGAFQVVDASGPGFTNGGATPADIVAIVDIRSSNTAETRTDGLDLSMDYGFGVGSDRFNIELNANRVFRFDDKLTVASPWIHTLDTPYNPVSWRARAGLSWQRGPLSAFTFLNYTGSYRDSRGTRDLAIGAFATVDAGIAFDGSMLSGGWAKRLRVALNVQNLFDTDPPKLLPAPGFHDDVGYDPVNASGRGRAITLQLRRSW